MTQNPHKRHKPSPTSSSSMTTIVLPSGDFTLETCMSISLLKFIIPPTNQLHIIHIDSTSPTFDTDLQTYKYDKNTYVIGIGNEYIPEHGVFHWMSSTTLNKQQRGKSKKSGQKKKTLNQNQNRTSRHYFNDSKRCKVVALATVGLIYRSYGKQIMTKITGFTDTSRIKWLFERAYFDYIEIIDAHTRGYTLYNVADDAVGKALFSDELQKLPAFVKYYNVQMHDREAILELASSSSGSGGGGTVDFELEFEKEWQRRFEIVVGILKSGFENYVKYFAFSFLHGEQVLISAYDGKMEDRIVVLDEFIPWKEHLFQYERQRGILGHCLYVVYPDSSKNWRLAAVPTMPGAFQSRKKLVDDWCGLSGEDLRLKCGVKDASFVHAQGFIAGADSKEGCIEMAKLAVKHGCEKES